MKKKILSVVLAALMVALLLPVTAVAAESVTAYDFDGLPVDEGPDTYKIIGNEIHVYDDSLEFSGETSKKFIIPDGDDFGYASLSLKNMIVHGDMAFNDISETVTVFMNNSTIDGDLSGDNGAKDLYLCVYLEGENTITGDVTSTGSFTVYGYGDGTLLKVKSVTSATMVYLDDMRVENIKENYVLGETLTLTPDNTAKPVKIILKTSVRFPDDSKYVINGGKPFKAGEKIKIKQPVVCDENDVPFDPQPKLDRSYYRVSGYSFTKVDGVPSKPGNYVVLFSMPLDDEEYYGSEFYDFSIREPEDPEPIVVGENSISEKAKEEAKEENPNTGAPVISSVSAFAVLAGAAFIISKKK